MPVCAIIWLKLLGFLGNIRLVPGLGPSQLERGVLMQEILTAVTYLVVWLGCEKVFHIESGLTKLLISVGAAVGVYVLMAVMDRKRKKPGSEDQ